jgi:hypothetical protein
MHHPRAPPLLHNNRLKGKEAEYSHHLSLRESLQMAVST